jgi:hypothetical protein
MNAVGALCRANRPGKLSEPIARPVGCRFQAIVECSLSIECGIGARRGSMLTEHPTTKSRPAPNTTNYHHSCKHDETLERRQTPRNLSEPGGIDFRCGVAKVRIIPEPWMEPVWSNSSPRPTMSWEPAPLAIQGARTPSEGSAGRLCYGRQSRTEMKGIRLRPALLDMQRRRPFPFPTRYWRIRALGREHQAVRPGGGLPGWHREESRGMPRLRSAPPWACCGSSRQNGRRHFQDCRALWEDLGAVHDYQ